MRFSTSVTRAFVAATPLGVALLVTGTALLVGWDRGPRLLLPGFLVLVGGVAATHTLLAPHYGGLGLTAFLLTEISFFLIALLGVGFLSLAVASPLLAAALFRMRPQLRLSAAALLGVWPVAAIAAATTPLSFFESIATMFPLPYASLAIESLRLPK